MSGENVEMSDESAVSEASEITDIEEEDETTSEGEYQSAGQCMYGNEPEYPTSHSSSESESDIDETAPPLVLPDVREQP